MALRSFKLLTVKADFRLFSVAVRAQEPKNESVLQRFFVCFLSVAYKKVINGRAVNIFLVWKKAAG